jgi:hypothetical protein
VNEVQEAGGVLTGLSAPNVRILRAFPAGFLDGFLVGVDCFFVGFLDGFVVGFLDGFVVGSLGGFL